MRILSHVIDTGYNPPVKQKYYRYDSSSPDLCACSGMCLRSNELTVNRTEQGTRFRNEPSWAIIKPSSDPIEPYRYDKCKAEIIEWHERKVLNERTTEKTNFLSCSTVVLGRKNQQIIRKRVELLLTMLNWIHLRSSIITLYPELKIGCMGLKLIK